MDFPPAAEVAFPAPAAGGEDGAATALVELARGGDEAAFSGVVALYEKRVFHFVMRTVSNAHDAEDVTQETFVKAWRALPRYRHRHSFTAWLFTIARRSALNHIRARRPMEELKDHDLPTDEDPGETAADREDAATVWTTARRLKPNQYEALWLCYGEGFAVGEIARIMNTNAINVRVLLHRARNRMAEWLTGTHSAARSS